MNGNESDFATVNAMIQFGGSFVRALAQACRLADTENLARIKAAFPEYWAKYEELASLKAAKDKGR